MNNLTQHRKCETNGPISSIHHNRENNEAWDTAFHPRILKRPLAQNILCNSCSFAGITCWRNHLDSYGDCIDFCAVEDGMNNGVSR